MNTSLQGALLAAGAIALAAPGALAQGTLTQLSGISAFNISPDGSTVVGSSAGSSVIWTNGITTPIAFGAGSPEAVSAFGIVVGGQNLDPILGQDAPAWWLQTTNQWSSLGAHPSLSGGCPDHGSVFGVSHDGSVMTGMMWDGCGTDAFTWSVAGGLVIHTDMLDSARANDISGDGMQSGGWIQTSSRKAALWDSAGNLTQPLAISHPTATSEIFGMGAPGNFTGWVNGSMFTVQDGVFTDVGALMGSSQSQGYAISESGHVAAGWHGTSGPFGVQNALIHTSWGGPQDGTAFLAQFGVTPPVGATVFNQFVDMDATGNNFVALIGSPPLFDYYHVSLPNNWVDLGGASSGTNGLPSLEGFGWLNPGMTAGIGLENALPGTIAALAYGGSYNPTPVYGGFLGPFPWDGLLFYPTGADGSVEVNFTWPLTMPSGIQLFLQFGVLDAAGTSDIALSNTLQATGN